MKVEKTTSDGRIVKFQESLFSGKKSRVITINDQQLVKSGKNGYIDAQGVNYIIKGSVLTKLVLTDSTGETINLVSYKWWEKVILWSPYLSLLVGIFGGFIGGGLSMLAATFGLVINVKILESKTMPAVLKIFLGIGVAVLAFIAWFMIYLLIVGGLAEAFPNIFG